MKLNFLLISTSNNLPLPSDSLDFNGQKVDVEIANNLEDVRQKLSKNYLNGLIIDSPFYIDNLNEVNSLLNGTPYFLINKNGQDLSSQNSIKPIIEFKDPLSENNLQLMVLALNLLEPPNYEYFNQLGDENLKTKMVELMQVEFEDFINDLPRMYEEEKNQDIFHLIHKISSKYSILGMPKTYNYIKSKEKKISEGNNLSDEEVQDLDVISKHVYNFLVLNP